MFDLSINYSVIVMTMFSVLTITNPITTIPYYFMLHPKSTHKETKKDGRRIALVVFLILVSAFLVG
jgi:small neutral amino acid transporter SnatA (MarC family)